MAPEPQEFEVAVVGGGIVGVASALALAESAPGISLVLLEKEGRLARHQTGNNSGVIHSGLYYRPGSLKARNCVEGREALYRFCAEEGVPHERCGKIVVATREEQLPALAELERRGRENGLEGMERLDPAGIRRHEPQAAGIAGLWVPQTGIVDFVGVTEALAKRLAQKGGAVRTGAEVRHVRREKGGFRLFTPGGEVRCRALVNCTGLHCDRFARRCGVDPALRIVPFRGEYYELAPERRALVRNLIYPVPDPAFPFLGVHFTRAVDGRVEAGPNAILSLKREGYGRFSFSCRDAFSTFNYPGFWRLARKHWRTGLQEVYRSLSKGAFARELQHLLPAIRPSDLERGGAGVRAQAVSPDGALLDDFRIVASEGSVHVLNAPSPAATASLCIGRAVAALALEHFRRS